MPLPTLALLVFGVGAGTALAAASELRLSPRALLRTDSFGAYALFLGLLVVPVSLYFYVFHGDWFLLYAVDVRVVPSALALAGLLLELALGVLGFAVGAQLTRAQRTGAGVLIAVASPLAGLAVGLIAQERLGVVGTYAQYRGGFGTTGYLGGPVMHAGLVMGGILLAGAAFLIWRLRGTNGG
ncbi:MAG: hypothetical protein MJD61_10195 [Proteobacteria bacterium]|nr:hypothetical protein [Pseudomonadota bacterium]